MSEYLVDLTMLAKMAMVSKGKILEIVNRGLLGVPEPIKVVKTITGRKFRYWDRTRVKQWLKEVDCRVYLAHESKQKSGIKQKSKEKVLDNRLIVTMFTDRTRPVILPGSIATKYVIRPYSEKLEEYDIFEKNRSN